MEHLLPNVYEGAAQTAIYGFKLASFLNLDVRLDTKTKLTFSETAVV